MVVGALLVVGRGPSRAQNMRPTPSRVPFSLEIPQLNRSGITALEVRVGTTQIHTLRIHIAEPAADQIAYEKIYTVVNAESANTIQTVTAAVSGKVVTLDLEKRERFHLRPGKNVIEINATGTGQQPYYASFVLNVSTDAPARSQRVVGPRISYQLSGRKYALVIGVSRYKFHEGGLKDLQYADSDSRSIAEFLKTSAGFKDSDISYLENENATVENVRAAVDLFLERAREDDLIFLFLAGHGAQDPFDPRNLYLILHDSKVTNMPRTALNMAELQARFIDRLRAKQMVILIDACHSGGVDPAEKSSFRQLERSENNTFNIYAEKLFSGESRALLTSSDVNEVSEEGGQWGGGHGVFTWAILEGLRGVADVNRDRVITTGELFDFVSAKVRQETNARQNPRALPGTDRDFPLTRVPNIGTRKL
ncbi:MAG TPA: caspase family protein [Pyrinomonadaceae bacterium]|nr:caspase family protein [Pyrinomonadaceae bacterium]